MSTGNRCYRDRGRARRSRTYVLEVCRRHSVVSTRIGISLSSFAVSSNRTVIRPCIKTNYASAGSV